MKNHLDQPLNQNYPAIKKSILIATLCFLQALFWLLLYHGLDTFIYPLTIAVILLYMSLPAIVFLETKCHLPAPIAVGLIFFAQVVVILTLLLIGIPYLFREISNLIQQLPLFVSHIFDALQTLSKSYDFLNFDDSLTRAPIQLTQTLQALRSLDATTLYNTLMIAQGTASQLLSPIFWIAYMIIMPVMYFFLAIQSKKIIPLIRSYTPLAYRDAVVSTLRVVNTIFSGYFRGQITVLSFLAFMYAAGLYLLNIPYGLAIGIMTGILSFIPYFGLFLGFTLASISSFYTSSSLSSFALLCLTFAIVNAIESLYLTPTFMGKRVGLSNVSSLLSIIIGANLFGLFGLVFAIPMAATGKHLFKQFATYCKHQGVL